MHIGFDGKMKKVGNMYAIEVAPLLIFTQAKTQKAGIELVCDAVEEMLEHVEARGFDRNMIHWFDKKDLKFRVYLPLNQPTIAFMLKQLRGYKAMSLADVAKKMGVSSKNSIAAYERVGPKGREPTIGKLSQFLDAMGVEARLEVGA